MSTAGRKSRGWRPRASRRDFDVQYDAFLSFFAAADLFIDYVPRQEGGRAGWGKWGGGGARERERLDGDLKSTCAHAQTHL